MSILHRRRIAAGALALAALLPSQVALAQQCIAPEDVTDAGIYAMPLHPHICEAERP